ncbi:MAG: BatA domain-containing protein [Myxococcaceae bacterium]|nr:BatA domain-containing protein [Myxococcaceae bacterium]
MTFAQPLLLWGCLGALIPLLVHLFDRRRPRPHPFGAISFVLKSQKRTASRLRLRRLLLYTLRTLILLAVPIALARPELSKAGTVSAGLGPMATVIVLDDSLSMRWRDTSGLQAQTLFERAKAEARSAVRDLLPEEPATVLVCGAAPLPPAPLSFDRARMLQALDEAQATYEAADASRCLELAARALEDSLLLAKRIVLVSDFAATSLRTEAPLPTVAGPKGERIRPEVVLRDVASSLPELPNRALLDVKVEPAPQVDPKAFAFTFTARNFSAEAMKDVELQLKVDGRVVAKGFFDLPAHGTGQKALTHRFVGGPVAVVEGVLAPDALTEDDTRTVVLPVPRELTALVVNGAPSPQKFRDEAFFVEAALQATGSPVRAVVRDTDAAFREDFAQYDVVLLLNVEAPRTDVAARLKAYVESGHGLFISMGDRVDPDGWNASMGGVLPRRLKLFKTAVEPGASDVGARSARLSQVAAEHPVLAPFTGRAREGLMSARFSRYMLLEPGAEGGQVLGTLDDGAPALVARRLGRGQVLLFTSTVDRDWSDFSIRTSFLPLMQRVAAWLSGSLEEREELKVLVGETAVLPTQLPLTEVELLGPEGVELKLTKQPDGALAAGPLAAPGAYVAKSEGLVVPSLSFAVSVDAAESDLTRLKPEELKAFFGDDAVKAGGQSSESKAPIWTWLIVAAVIAFFLEGLLLPRR